MGRVVPQGVCLGGFGMPPYPLPIIIELSAYLPVLYGNIALVATEKP